MTALFTRVLQVLLPDGGGVIVITEGYFDESGSFEEEPQIFCIAGYFIESVAAEVMDHKWGQVLEQHGIPYFHMVDCAHGVGVFAGKSSAERTEIVAKMISLIKTHTFEGFSVLARHDRFTVRDDVYSVCAGMAVDALQVFLNTHRISGDMAFFFENGHKSQGKAYVHMAQQVKGLPATVSFGEKEKVKLLQAADLLAWQTLKYAKDKHYESRPPRKDFMVLMQHRHTFFWLSEVGDDRTLAIEMWP